MQFSVFGHEIHCETTATRKAKVKPLRTYFDNCFTNQYFENRACMAEVSN